MNYLKELLFPMRCPICDEIVGKMGRLICPRCYTKLRPIRGSTCCKCGKLLENDEREYCKDCERIRHLFDRNYSLYEYSDIARSIYRFKYGGRQEYASFYGLQLARSFQWLQERHRFDGIVPVPLHKERFLKRGYNQAELMAKVLGKAWNVPVYNKLIIRDKKTIPQKELNVLERQNNLKKAFKILQNEVKLNTIIIVDDIYTTGCTLDTIAELFRENGTDKIYGITLAIGREQ